MRGPGSSVLHRPMLGQLVARALANSVYLCTDKATQYRCPNCGHPLMQEFYPGALYCEGCAWSEYEPGEFCSPRGCDHTACDEADECVHVCNHGKSVVPERTDASKGANA